MSDLSGHPHDSRDHADDHDPEALLRHAEAVAGRAGFQLTPLRRRIFAEVAASASPLGAYDLVERLSGTKRIAPISVYRVLDALMEVGLVHRIASRNTYLACHHAHDPLATTVFLVCRTCGGVDETASPSLARELGGTSAAAGFKPAGSIEVEGECAQCRETVG